MKSIAVAATVPASEENGTPEKTATISVQYPDLDGDAKVALEEAAQAYGAKAILTNAFSNWKITLQAGIRSGLKKGETQEQLQVRLGGAKMGVASVGAQIDPQQAFISLFQSSTPEKQAELLAQLKTRAATAGAGQAAKK